MTRILKLRQFLNLLEPTVLCVFILLSSLVGCDDIGPVKVSGSEKEEKDEGAGRLVVSPRILQVEVDDRDKRPLVKFGAPPFHKDQTQEDLRSKYKVMIGWLEQQTKSRIQIVPIDSYDEVVELLVTGKVDLACLSPAMYVFAKQEKQDLKLMVTELTWISDKTQKIDGYMGYIIARSSHDELDHIEDLKKKTFAYVSRKSTSGFQYPNMLLQENGIDDKDLGKIYFLGSHSSVTDAIAAGSVDAGATWEFNYQFAKRKHGDIFKKILTYGPIPNLCIVSHPQLGEQMYRKFQGALMSIPEEKMKGLSAVGYTVQTDEFYDRVRKVVDFQEMEELE